MWLTDCKIRTPFSKYFSYFYFYISSKFKNTVNFYNLIGSCYSTIIVCCVLCFWTSTRLKSFLGAFPCFSPFFCQKRKKRRKSAKKHAFSPGVDQLLGVNQRLRVTTKRWKIPFFMHVFLFIFCAFSSFSVCDRKRQKSMF